MRSRANQRLSRPVSACHAYSPTRADSGFEPAEKTGRGTVPQERVMNTLREALAQAQASGTAIGHFNVADLVLLKAVFAVARERNVAALVGASEGEREFAGTRQLAALV